MYEHKLNEQLSLTLTPKIPGIAGDRFLALWLDAWANVSRGLFKTITVAMVAHPEIGEIISGFEAPVSSKGNPITQTAKLISFANCSLTYTLRRPCRCCGEASVDVPLPWIEARDLLNPAANHAELTRHSDPTELVNTAPGISFYRDTKVADYKGIPYPIKGRSTIRDSSICAACALPIRIAAVDKKRREVALEEQEAQEKARRREARKTALIENPPYLVIVGTLSSIEEHNAAVNAKLGNGYCIWGQPISTQDGHIAQTVMRYDNLKNRPNVSENWKARA